MPQLFQVLRCYKCMVFQVHQTKKSIKFECKLCGEKQSIKRHYGLGTGQECRLHVQKLNGIRGEIDEMNTNKIPNSDEENEIEELVIVPQKMAKTKTNSKWSNYVEKCDVAETDTSNRMYLENTEVVLELPQKRKGTQKFGSHQRKKFTEPYLRQENMNEEDNFEHDHSISRTQKLIEPIQRTVSESSISTTYAELVCQEIKIDKKNIPKFKPPTINKNSKWAQFAAEEENNEELETHKQSQINNHLFNLCDDGDLDNILDL